MSNSIKKPDMSVEIAGVTLKNPIITASGTCGYGMEYLPYYSPADIGAITVKAVTLEKRAGNPPPRIAETPSGILNSIGLQNPGVEHFLQYELPELRKIDDTVIIANIAGKTEDEYCEVARRLQGSAVDMIEMNISCPNVKEGGAAFGTNRDTVERITSLVKKCTDKPLIVKLSPNVTSITEMAKAAEAGGADALSLINTLLGMRIDIKTKRPIMANNVGGLSGPAVFPVAVRMVWQVRGAVSLPIIGMGGVATPEMAAELMIAGADAVSIGTAMFTDPYAPVKIRDGLEKICTDKGLSSVRELTATVVPN